jgi:DNA-binding transcriptional LysR family regulator
LKVHAPCAILHSLDWNDLRYFLALARVGTLAGAARELGVEHTTVGRRIAALESDLGVRLFVRGPAGMTLTAAGNEILGSAQSMAELVKTIERRVNGVDDRVEGTVRMTIPEALNAYLVPELPALRRRHPALLIDLLSDNREVDLRRGEADLAVRIRDTTDPELLVRKLGSAGWSLYAAPSYVQRKGVPLSLDDLTGHDVIGFDGSLSGVEGAIWLRERASTTNIVLRGNSLTAVYGAAAVGLGIAPLPCFSADRDPALQRLTPALIGSREILLVVHPDLARVARVRATMDFLIELFARDAKGFGGRR